MRKKSGTEYPINNKLVYKRKGENEYRTQVSNKEMGREVLYLSIRESWQQQKKKKEGGDISIIHSVYQMEVTCKLKTRHRDFMSFIGQHPYSRY